VPPNDRRLSAYRNEIGANHRREAPHGNLIAFADGDAILDWHSKRRVRAIGFNAESHYGLNSRQRSRRIDRDDR